MVSEEMGGTVEEEMNKGRNGQKWTKEEMDIASFMGKDSGGRGEKWTNSRRV